LGALVLAWRKSRNDRAQTEQRFKIEVYQAQAHVDAPRIRDLFSEYLYGANARLNKEYGIDFDIPAMIEQDMAGLKKFMPPGGRLLLARWDGQVAGLACMRQLDDEMGEVKRMYVRPAMRRRGIGRALLSGLLDEARATGYRRVRLDSARYMVEAHALYRSFGFREIEPYPESEIPGAYQAHWVYMEKDVR
jgi:GNAT superfamily N-acetyltransferase